MDKAMWTVPGTRMKMKREHKVPLATQAIELLEQLKVFSGDSDYVLPGRLTAKKPISENTLLFAIYRAGYKDRINNWRVLQWIKGMTVFKWIYSWWPKG